MNPIPVGVRGSLPDYMDREASGQVHRIRVDGPGQSTVHVKRNKGTDMVVRPLAHLHGSISIMENAEPLRTLGSERRTPL